MNINEIEKIVKIFEGSTLSKMELSGEDVTIKLEKGTEAVAVMPVSAVPQAIPEVATVSSAPMAEAKPAIEEGFWVTSPLVGTFYQSNVKGGDPLVKVGDAVKKGDLLCIIEAMKMMNEIRSDRNGIIKAVNVENETMVEFDQKLICIGDKE